MYNSDMKDGQQTVYRIGMGMSILWVVIAIIGDLLSLIPFVGTAVAPVFWICFTYYGWKKGLGLINPKKVVTTALSVGAEVAPLLQFLPALAAGIVAILLMVRAEDKTGISLIKPVQKGVTPPRLKRIPVNLQEGRREARKKTVVDNNADFPLDAGEIAF